MGTSMTNVEGDVGVNTEPTVMTERKTEATMIETVATVTSGFRQREKATIQSAWTGTNFAGMGVKKEEHEHLDMIVLPEIRVTDE